MLGTVALTIDELDSYLDRHVNSEDRKKLSQAHWRYMNLIGIVDDGVEAELVASDRKHFEALICRHEDRSVFDENDCTRFMTQISGLPTGWCYAWMKRDFLQPLEA